MFSSFPYAYADYFAFVSAIASLMVGTNSMSLHQVGGQSRKWLWLVAAMVCAGVASMVQAAALDLGLGAAPLRLQALLLALATFFALGFLLRGDLADRDDSEHQMRTPLLMGLGVGGAIVVALIVLGSRAGAWALAVSIVVAFLAIARLPVADTGLVHSESGRSLASVGLVVWAIAQAVVQVTIGRSDTGILAVWAIGAGAVGATLAAVGFGRCLSAAIGAWSGGGEGALRSRTRGVLLALLAVGLAAGLMLTTFLGNLGAQRLLDDLERRAHTAASMIQPSPVEGLSAGPSDTYSGAYRDLIAVLDRTLEANPDITYLYLMRAEAGRAVILAEAQADDGQRDQPGTVFQEASPALLDALVGGTALLEGPVTDSDGVWYSALYPIVDPATGDVIAHVGMDLAAERVTATALQYRLAGILLSLAVSALIIGFYIVLQMTRAAAAAMSDSESRFRGLFESAPDAIMVVSAADGELLSANPMLCEWLGIAREQLLGASVWKFVHCTRGCPGEGCDLEVGKRLEDRCVLRSADGSERDVELTSLESDYDGQPATVVFVRDVSTRVRAEEAVAAQATFNALVTDISRRFVDATPDTIDTEIESALARIGAYSDVDRVYVFAFDDGAHMSNTHEWTAEGIPTRKQAFDHAPIKGYPWLISQVNARREVYLPDVGKDPNLDAEERLALQSAGIRSMLVVPVVIFGTAVGMLGFDSVRGLKDWSAESIALLRMMADIIGAAQRRTDAEGELLILSQAVGQSPVAVVITDRNGDVEYVNPTFTRITGYELGEVRGQNPRILKSGLTPDETYKDLWTQLLAGEVWTGEFVNRRKDGMPYWARATISAMRTPSGEITHFIGVQEDVTEAQEAQEALKTAKIQAESANRAKSEFLATMSHEIRTPMNAIIGMSELLQDTELTKQQERYVDVFRRAGESLLGLINSILDLSKIEADRLEMENIPFDLCDVAETAASVIGVQAAEKGLELLYRIKPGTPTELLGDPDRLRQVFINLLGNAVKFTEIGQVLLSIEQQPDQAPGNLLLSVSDTGVGIPEDKLGKVFESFSQADASTTRRYGGTGLGLTISKRLVELMGGSMRVESTLGRGTTFIMEIPFLVAREGVKGTRRESPPPLAGRRVLVVDDNETNRFILREVLTAWGMRTSDAPDGLAGLEALRFAERAGDPYDVLVLDHQMPNMDGFELLEQVRAEKPISRVPAIMLSSDAHGRDQARAARLNLLDYLFKPVRRHELQDALQSALSAEWRTPVAAEQTAVSASDTRRLRVLLVEDSEDNRFLIESYLAKTDHELVEAVDGQQAVDTVIAEEGRFDLVFMDMQMPVKDGLAATREIREWERSTGREPLRIVALSAFALKEEHARSLEAGCDAHLTKPIKKKELLRALAEYSRSESHVC